MVRELAGSTGNLFWSHGGGGGGENGGFAYINQFFGLENLSEKQDFRLEDQLNQEADRLIKKRAKENNEEAVVANALLKLRPFGLKLNVTPCLVDSVDNNLNHATKPHHHPKVNDFGSQPISEKLKASNFSASLLRIGAWERKSRNEGDLVAKCYYAKKKLVWEFLENGLKNKIEIQWNDIIAMKARIQENEPGILEIELSRAPTFHEETDPQPRKHTIWRLTSDFTRGQASTFRRHYLVFPPGALDKHYEKLLQCDQRLYGLSRRSFPSLESPYFEPNIFNSSNYSFNYPRERQFNFSGIPSPLAAVVHYGQYEPHVSFKETPSPISVMDFSHSDDQLNNNVIENQRIAMWAAQGMDRVNSNVVDPLATASIQFNQMNTQMDSTAISYNNYISPSAIYRPSGGSNLVNDMILSSLAEDLLSDTEVECYDQKYHMERVASLGELLKLPQEANQGSEDSSQHTFNGQSVGADDDMSLSCNDQARVELEYQQQLQPQPQPISWFSSEFSPQNAMMNHDQAWNDLSYPSVSSSTDSRTVNCGNANTVDQLKFWN